MIPLFIFLGPLLGLLNTGSNLMIPKVEDFTITGDGASNAWENVTWTTIPQQGFDGIQADTRVKVLYSEKGLYFLFVCEDEKITSTLREDNADLWTEDVVEVFIWTDRRHPIYFEYELSPFNYELPLIIPNIDNKFLGWIPWNYTGERRVQHATTVKGGKKEAGGAIDAWIAEFFIPFDLLKPLANVPPEKGIQWNMNFYRVDYDQGLSTWAWQPVQGTFHQFKEFGGVTFQ